jgi:hypothetical protein
VPFDDAWSNACAPVADTPVQAGARALNTLGENGSDVPAVGPKLSPPKYRRLESGFWSCVPPPVLRMHAARREVSWARSIE